MILRAWEWLVGVLNGNSSTIPGNAVLYVLGVIWLDLRSIARVETARVKDELHDHLKEHPMTDVSASPFLSEPVVEPAPVPVRKAGKRGARESHEPRLMLSQFRGGVSTGYREWDGSHAITDWGMDGNDRYSNCGAAAVDHGNMAKADDASLLGSLGQPKFAGMLATYFAYGIAQGEPGPDPDQGVDNASWLAFLYENGIIDGYGEVPLDELDRYAADFNGLLIGVQLSDNAEQEFEATPPIPWGQPGDTPDPTEGHDTWLIVTHTDGSIELLTWGAAHACSRQFRTENITDAWAILDEDDAKRTGTDWAALTATLQSISGAAVTVEPDPVMPAPVDPLPAPEPVVTIPPVNPVDPSPAPIVPVPDPTPVDPSPESGDSIIRRLIERAEAEILKAVDEAASEAAYVRLAAARELRGLAEIVGIHIP